MDPTGIRARNLAMTAFVAAVAASGSALAGDASARAVAMPYGDCTAIIAEAARDLDMQPVTLAAGADLMLVRFDAEDGSVTISCRRSTDRMALSKTTLPLGTMAISESVR
jgi:hypothetical protein